MSWTSYLEDFVNASEACVEFAKEKINVSYPKDIICSLEFDGSRESMGDEKIKYIGGRLLSKSELENISVQRAAKLTYADGKIPKWVNFYVTDKTDDKTIMIIVPSKDLVVYGQKANRFQVGVNVHNKT